MMTMFPCFCEWRVRGRVVPSDGLRRGAVLMEVILALILFVGAAAVLTGGMNASIQTLDRTRLNLHAANLAVSIMSELQMGLRPAITQGEEPFDAPFEEWTWELNATDLFLDDRETESADGSSSTATSGVMSVVKVEVVIRHGFESIVHRLVQAVPVVTVVTLEETGANVVDMETELGLP